MSATICSFANIGFFLATTFFVAVYFAKIRILNKNRNKLETSY